MIQLFKKGTSSVHQGVTCDAQLVNEFGFEPLLAENGGEWYLDPNDCYVEEEECNIEAAVDDVIEDKFKSSLSAKEE